MKKIRGENYEHSKIPSIDTLCGRFSGVNVIEGFCANTEFLCNEKQDIKETDDSFLEMCKDDNTTIFEIASNQNIQITLMTIDSLKDILFKKLKLGKACDVYKLTVEHLRYSGDETLLCVVALLNKIITHIKYLSANRLNT